MNKSILIAIPIVIIAIILGIYSVSSETELIDEEPQPEIDVQDDSEPKRYSQSLSEAVTVVAP